MPARIRTSVASVVHAAPAGLDDGIATKFVVRLDTVADPVSMIERRSWPTALAMLPPRRPAKTSGAPKRSPRTIGDSRQERSRQAVLIRSFALYDPSRRVPEQPRDETMSQSAIVVRVRLL
jgi:hypothetical protein